MHSRFLNLEDVLWKFGIFRGDIPLLICLVNDKAAPRAALLFVPGAGVEPARLATSVFETDASTNSAIRADRS